MLDYSNTESEDLDDLKQEAEKLIQEGDKVIEITKFFRLWAKARFF